MTTIAIVVMHISWSQAALQVSKTDGVWPPVQQTRQVPPFLLIFRLILWIIFDIPKQISIHKQITAQVQKPQITHAQQGQVGLNLYNKR